MCSVHARSYLHFAIMPYSKRVRRLLRRAKINSTRGRYFRGRIPGLSFEQRRRQIRLNNVLRLYTHGPPLLASRRRRYYGRRAAFAHQTALVRRRWGPVSAFRVFKSFRNYNGWGPARRMWYRWTQSHSKARRQARVYGPWASRRLFILRHRNFMNMRGVKRPSAPSYDPRPPSKISKMLAVGQAAGVALTAYNALRNLRRF